MVIYTSEGCRLLKKIQTILQQFYSYFKEIIAIESNRLNSKSLDFDGMTVEYDGRVYGSRKPAINQCIGEELLRNYHNTQPISFMMASMVNNKPDHHCCRNKKQNGFWNPEVERK